jgi:hypothetical protein
MVLFGKVSRLLWATKVCFMFGFAPVRLPIGRYAGALLLCVCLLAPQLQSQDMLAPAEYTGVNIPISDLAIFEAGVRRDDLRCRVQRTDPVLGFDLNYHTGYQAEVPFAELAGGENTLSVLFRIYPVDRPREKQYFLQRFRVPDLEIDEDNPPKGSAMLEGTVLAGSGSYKVDWLMRDRRERVCADSWTFEVSASPNSVLPVTLEPGVVQHAPAHPFRSSIDEYAVFSNVPKSNEAASLHLKVLIHFAPLNMHSAVLQPVDLAALASILRSISGDNRVDKVSLVVFNVREQRVLFRQGATRMVDFPAIGDAIDTLNQGTVKYDFLADKHSDTRFLTELITDAMALEDRVDGIIFVGPKVMLAENPPTDLLGEVGSVDFPVFYVNYNLNPKENPWRDAIGHAVRYFRGHEFTVHRPQDLFPAVRRMFSQIESHKLRKSSAGVDAQ